MKNVTASIKGNILTLQVDLSETHGKSGSGKTTIIGSSCGNYELVGRPGVFVGLNVYKKA